jgi:hypothetical protein
MFEHVVPCVVPQYFMEKNFKTGPWRIEFGTPYTASNDHIRIHMQTILTF